MSYSLTRQVYNKRSDEYDHVPIAGDLTLEVLLERLGEIEDDLLYEYYVTEFEDAPDPWGNWCIISQDNAETWMADHQDD